MDYTSFALSVGCVLLPMIVVLLVRAGAFGLVKHEGKCYLLAIPLGVYMAYRSPLYVLRVKGAESIPFILRNIIIGVVLGLTCLVVAKVIKAIQKQAQSAKQEKSQNKKLEAGTWEFPCQKFYQICQETGINTLNDNEFTKLKLKKAVQYILEKNNVPQKYWQKYLDNGSVYYRRAQEEQKIQKQKAAEEKVIRESTVTEYTPSENEKRLLVAIEEIRTLKGVDKRYTMLQNEVSALEIQYRRVCNDANGLSKPVEIQWQKENNWATWGGFASALGGPAAGVMTAMDIQQRNAQIQQNNKVMLEAGMYLEQLRQERKKAADSECYNIAMQIKAVKDQLDKLSLKVVLDTLDSAAICRYLTLKKAKFEKMESGVLAISAGVDCQIPQEQLPTTGMVVDGTIHAKLYLKDMFVKDVYFVLPQNGISVNTKNATVHSISTLALPVPGDYHLILGDQTNLWIMEA